MTSYRRDLASTHLPPVLPHQSQTQHFVCPTLKSTHPCSGTKQFHLEKYCFPPQPAYLPVPFAPLKVATFELQEYPGIGVRTCDALWEPGFTASMMRGAQDRILRYCTTDPLLRISWPQYTAVTLTRPLCRFREQVSLCGTGPVTRWEVAAMVAEQFSDFRLLVMNEPGHGALRAAFDFFLQSLYVVGENIFEAEFKLGIPMEHPDRAQACAAMWKQ